MRESEQRMHIPWLAPIAMLVGRRRTYAVALLPAVLLTYVLWPKDPPLELYTTPPLTYQGKTVRLQALVPAGWKADPPRMSQHNTSFDIGGGQPPPHYPFVRLHPAYGPWLPSWLPAWLRGPDPRREHSAELHLTYGWMADAVNRTISEQGSINGVIKTWNARHGVPSGNAIGTVYYVRTNRPAFEDTYFRICESLRVLP